MHLPLEPMCGSSVGGEGGRSSRGRVGVGLDEGQLTTSLSLTHSLGVGLGSCGGQEGVRLGIQPRLLVLPSFLKGRKPATAFLFDV